MKLGKFFLPVVALIGVALFGSCSDDDGMDKDLNLYQEYEVYLSKELKAGYANFRKNGSQGERMELTNGSKLTINAIDTYYLGDAGNEFNYSAEIDSRHTKAVFKFTRSKNNVLTNEISFDVIPDVTFPDDLSEISLDDPTFRVNLNGADPASVNVYFMSTYDGPNATPYPAFVGFDGICSAGGVPPGNYTLYAESEITVPTVQNDGFAGGQIHLIKRESKRNVRIVTSVILPQ